MEEWQRVGPSYAQISHPPRSPLAQTYDGMLHGRLHGTTDIRNSADPRNGASLSHFSPKYEDDIVTSY
jgi:hypothetical protein